MGIIHQPPSVLPIVAIFSRHEDAFERIKPPLELLWGKVALESDLFPFEQTNYYEASMGASLKKQLLAFLPLIDPVRLAEMKIQSNALEEDVARNGNFADSRPINIDPGYVDLGKLVLASSKDFAHRIYLQQGIFAEITLFYSKGAWRDHPWTFPDYRESTYHSFLNQCREIVFRERKIGNVKIS
ncbi:MAG: DUF4416 family protein [Planctomycetia bacterium]|nr:DUF4416 family protein [Planctomycetia bacterium]